MRLRAAVITTILLFLTLTIGPAFASENVLEAVRDRGYVKCSIGNRLVGDTRIGEAGYEGFFPEFCRVVALAIFGDRTAVEMSPTLIRHGLESISTGDCAKHGRRALLGPIGQHQFPAGGQHHARWLSA